MGQLIITFTDDGTLALLQSEILVDGLKTSPLEVLFPYGTYRRKAKESMQGIGVLTVVSHELILDKATEDLLHRNITTIEQVREKQLLKDGEEYHIDDFGFYVYFCNYATEGQDKLIDNRYEIPKPPNILNHDKSTK